ncbi:hypothetical protein MBUL_04270 [Methylobacterium bullatum]|uniref:Uncharacterized protein n=1 Tax=Methylobacterium bullatum TaxID=570505 RepID=A0A679J5J4_9HYPH|nr:hypothetical protein MBUL_04270 [Methylobacterium bullatum]
MTSYMLSGFAALTRSNQSFIIPYFSARLSNYSYAQELNKDFKISKFLRFRPEMYRIVDCQVPKYIRSTGDDGILSFQTQHDNIIAGDYEEILRKLGKLDLSNFSPFFRMEAYSLLGDEELLHRSNCEAANLFSKESHTSFWIEASQNLARTSLSKRYNLATQTLEEPEQLDRMINRLLENPSDEDWYHEWKRQWSDSRGSLRLVKLALWWINKSSTSEPYLPYILEDILIRFKDDKESKETALQWLVKGEYHSQQWPKLWELYNLNTEVSEPLFSHGLSFLDHTLKLGNLKDNEYYWTSIWDKLWSEQRHVTYMVGLAQSAIKYLGKSDIFIVNVLSSVLDANRINTLALDTLDSWMKTSRNYSLVWEKVFLYFLNDTTYRKTTTEFAYKILETNPESPIWFFVLKSLWRGRPSHELVKIAKNWTKTQSKNSANWQDVMILILQSGYADDNDRLLAKKVSQYSDHYQQDNQFQKLSDYIKYNLEV